jgi:hypothetical protein
VIFSRYGGVSSTSSGEAILRSGHGCSSPLLHEVIRSPWRRGDRGCRSSPKGGSREAVRCSSAVTPRGRRRMVATTLRDMLASYLFVPGCFL